MVHRHTLSVKPLQYEQENHHSVTGSHHHFSGWRGLSLHQSEPAEASEQGDAGTGRPGQERDAKRI